MILKRKKKKNFLLSWNAFPHTDSIWSKYQGIFLSPDWPELTHVTEQSYFNNTAFRTSCSAPLVLAGLWKKLSRTLNYPEAGTPQTDVQHIPYLLLSNSNAAPDALIGGKKPSGGCQSPSRAGGRRSSDFHVSAVRRKQEVRAGAQVQEEQEEKDWEHSLVLPYLLY